MGKRISPAVIGAFVVASLTILIVALVVVGSGKMFKRPIRFICMSRVTSTRAGQGKGSSSR